VGDVIGLTCYLYTLEARLPRLLPPVENYRYRLFIILAYPFIMQCCKSRMFFPDPDCFLGSRILQQKENGKNKLLVLPFL
jgi:hypothetical protein